MIDRKTAIEELDTKICFIPQKYANSDMSVKNILAEDEKNCEFLSTEGEIAILLEYDPLTQLNCELKDLRAKLISDGHLQIIQLINPASVNEQIAKYVGKVEMLNEISNIINELRSDIADPPTIKRSRITDAERYLAENGIDDDETQRVLQEICNILFETELYSNKTELVCGIIEPMKRKG